MILDLNTLTIEQLKVLNSLPGKIQEKFNELTHEILQSTSGGIESLFSNIVSRHPYQSSLFDVCIKLDFINFQLKSENITQIIVDDVDLYRILKKSEIKCPLKIQKVNLFKWWIISKTKKVKQIIRIFLTIFRGTFSRQYSRTNKLRSVKKIILIDTFLLQNSIKEKKYVDRYYTGILDYLSQEDKNQVFFLPLIIGKYSRKNLKEIYQNSEENIIFSQDFLKVSDYIKSIILLFKHKVSKESQFFFEGYNLTDYIRKSVANEKFNSSAYTGLLNYFFFNRLKRENIDLKLVIDWNENQPIDKGLIKGAHDFYPEIKVKGYRAFIISHDYNLYLSPTEYEVENKVIPDEIVVMGNLLIKDIKRFTANIKVSSCPAFRFMNIYEPLGINSIVQENILVALPIGFSDSVEIIRMLFQLKDTKGFEKYKVVIKSHPTTSLNRLKETVSSFWTSNFSWANGSFRDNILKSWLFISNTSSAIMESLAYGVPGIIIGSKNSITQNPIPKSVDHRLWKLVYTSQELAEAINYYANISKKEKETMQIIGGQIKKEFFEPVTKESVFKFLEINS